tara:strand:+ start:217 stop:801 length:585 start_codon:yes stop_codon:yes gene_type:complete
MISLNPKTKFIHIFQLISLVIVGIFFLQSCGPLKYKPTKAGEVPTDPKERVKKNIEEGRGFRLMGGIKKGGTFDFASSNYLWRATLDTIDFMPLVSANYSGGIIITDWYSENNSEKESIKISIRFLSNEIRSDAIDVKVFIKECDQNLNCVVNQNQGKLPNELIASILRKAAKYEKEGIEKNKKEKPYKNSDLE